MVREATVDADMQAAASSSPSRCNCCCEYRFSEGRPSLRNSLGAQPLLGTRARGKSTIGAVYDLHEWMSVKGVLRAVKVVRATTEDVAVDGAAVGGD